MTTRLSKIARLPAKIREQLNHRLHDGELSRTILPWVNNLPKTKKIMAELFAGKPITHQNLSEWRATGYQDWLFHQNRLQWFSRLEEEDAETSQHDGCSDTYPFLPLRNRPSHARRAKYQKSRRPLGKNGTPHR